MSVIEEVVAKLSHAVEVKSDHIRVVTDEGELIIKPGNENSIDESSNPPVLYLKKEVFEVAKKKSHEELASIAKRVLSEIKKRGAQAKPSNATAQQQAPSQPKPAAQPQLQQVSVTPQIQTVQQPYMQWKSKLMVKYTSVITAVKQSLTSYRAPYEVTNLFDKVLQEIDEVAAEAEQRNAVNTLQYLDQLTANVLNMTNNIITYSLSGRANPISLIPFYHRVLIHVQGLRNKMKMLLQVTTGGGGGKS